jgi:hypothetical protein
MASWAVTKVNWADYPVWLTLFHTPPFSNSRMRSSQSRIGAKVHVIVSKMSGTVSRVKLWRWVKVGFIRCMRVWLNYV